MKSKILLFLALLFTLSSCTVLKKSKSSEIEEKEVKTEVSSIEKEVVVQTVHDTVRILDSVFVQPEQVTEVELRDLCDSLGRLRYGISLQSGNASVKSDSSGNLKIRCECEERISRIQQEKTSILKENSLLKNRADSLETRVKSLRVSDKEVQKTKISFKTIVFSAGGWILALFFLFMWIKSKFF